MSAVGARVLRTCAFSKESGGPTCEQSLLHGGLRAVSDPLTDEEVDHIDQWPNAHKEQLRGTFLRSFDDDRSVRFFWGIYGGAAPDTVIRDLGQLRIVVPSVSRVRLEGDATGSVPVAS
jgi:hypothetical protein